jgi:hypothetical protein
MSRRPTRQLTWQFVLRTLARVRMMMRLDAKQLAKQLVENGVSMQGGDTFLSDIGDYMKEIDRDFYVNGSGRRHDKCAQCGQEIMCDHNGAIYCSRECRQRAYRVRRTAAEGRNSPIPKRSRPKTIALAGGVFELRLKKPRRQAKRRATPLDDASITPGDETNVTAVHEASP